MNISTVEVRVPDAEDVTVTEDTLTAELSDGRTISVPLAWYPRLVNATEEERGQLEAHRRRPGHPLGPTWTRTSAWRGCLRAGHPARVRSPSSSGSKRSRQAEGVTLDELRGADGGEQRSS